MRRRFRHLWIDLSSFLQSLASGDQTWGRFRFLLALVLLIGVLLGIFIVADQITGLLKAVIEPVVNPLPPSTPGPLPTPGPSPTPGLVPVPTPTPAPGLIQRLAQGLGERLGALFAPLAQLVERQIRLFPSRARYLLAAVLALVIVLMNGARYIQDIYEMHSYRLTLHYLLSSIFAILPYPRLRISAGQKMLLPSDVNLLDVIGGPGYVTIAPGNVVLFERLHGPAAVRSAGTHFVSRFETIKTIISLEEQHGEFEKLSALTKDGIQVEARNVRFRYRLHPGRRWTGPVGRAWTDPYPYSTRAVLNMTYGRNVRGDGLMPWNVAVGNAVDSAVTDYFASHTLDQLTAPGMVGGDPRKEILKALFSSGTRNALRGVGAELLFCDIGQFAIKDEGIEADVRNQRVMTWQARWIGQANLMRSDAEAQRLAFQELGRAEAQAEMLMSVAGAFQDIGLEGDSRQHMRNIILMRTAQILEALSEQNSNNLLGKGR